MNPTSSELSSLCNFSTLADSLRFKLNEVLWDGISFFYESRDLFEKAFECKSKNRSAGASSCKLLATSDLLLSPFVPTCIDNHFQQNRYLSILRVTYFELIFCVTRCHM
ncbi:hypothetical protein CEXT_747041 [Caerostris extrusa]|uniref:Uncharacterized protein n=1 Tax=Caerostris extrusa TaxID=172846 RepID=A0AAV4P2X1_CAEEX|nr:hypothetical protein CEXT_747041 [Caerostris extrusa]